MEYIATFDIGTTAAKGMLVAQGGSIQGDLSVSLETSFGADGRIEQDPEQWWHAVRQIAGSWWQMGYRAESVALIVCSGQMQDCLPVDSLGNPLRKAILYSDGRAGTQAQQIAAFLGEAEIRRITGNHFDGTMTFPKIRWLQEQEPDIYRQTHCFLINAKDYIIRQLTGRNVTDPTTAATTGMLNLAKREWATQWVEAWGIDRALLPELLAAGEMAGGVTQDAAAMTGFAMDTPVLCGIGDAGAATIGAGATEVGEIYAYLGTTGWVAVPTRHIDQHGSGVFNLAHYPPDLTIAIAPLTNAGNVHQWAASLFESVDGFASSEVYQNFEDLVCQSPPGARDVLFLPYLNGERCPIQDPMASGCFVGLRGTTGRSDLCRAVLEGVAMSIRQVMEILIGPRKVERLVLVGGGGKSKAWCQIIADVCMTEVVVPFHAEFLPSLGAASIGCAVLGWTSGYECLAKKWLLEKDQARFYQNRESAAVHQRAYQKYLALYPAFKKLGE